MSKFTSIKLPERYAWDDDPTNNHGWYDADEADKYIEYLRGALKHYACQYCQADDEGKLFWRDCYKYKACRVLRGEE